MFLASNAAAFLRETRTVQFPGDGEIVALRPEGATFQQRRRHPGRARAGRARLGRRGRGEGRLRDVHAQGDLRAAGRRRRDDRRPRPPRHARPRGARHVRRGRQGASPHRPSRCGTAYHACVVGPVRDRGVGARPRRVRHRERVDLPKPGDQRARPRHRDHAVGRDARHDRGAQARAREGRTHGRHHEHDGLAGDARGRLGPVHARRPRDGRRLVEDASRRRSRSSTSSR